MRNTVAIVGSHPATSKLFDFSRQDCDVWVFNEAAQKDFTQRRADAVFQMHAPVIWRNPANRNDPGHYNWLISGNTPLVYMQEQYPEVPKSEKYPRDNIRQKLLANFNGGQEYYTSSPAYALALAIYMGYRRIEIYGVEMETDTEYRFQRDGIAFWLGLATGRGIDVILNSKQLLVAPLYGYEGDVRLEYEYFVNRITELEENAKTALADYNAEREVMNAALDRFLNSEINQDGVVTAINEAIKKAGAFGMADGARQENLRYKKKADIMREAAGGEFVFVRQEFEQAGMALMKEREKQLSVINAFAVQLGQAIDYAAQAKNRDRRKVRVEKVTKIIIEYVKESVKMGVFMGAAIENKNHLDKLTELIRAAGGSKSEAVMLEALRVAV